MVMGKDRRGMAVLVDALLFLAALSVISALMLVPPPADGVDGRQEMLGSYHSVMLAGETTGLGGVLSQSDLASFIILAAADGSLNEEEIGHLQEASAGTLRELGGMGHKVWWCVWVGGLEQCFGLPGHDFQNVYSDRRCLGDGAACALCIGV